MEIHDGVFVSRVNATEWEADPDVGGEWHVLVAEPVDAYALTGLVAKVSRLP